MSFSNPSTKLIHLGFPAVFEFGVRDPLRGVAYCRLSRTAGFFIDLCDLFSQLCDALLDWSWHAPSDTTLSLERR
jgi:hypothetical protein